MNFLSLLRAYGSTLFLSIGLLIGGLATLPVESAQATPALPSAPQAMPDDTRLASAAPPTFPLTALLAPGNGSTLSDPWPTFDWADATDPDGVVSYTLLVTGAGSVIVWDQGITATIDTVLSVYTPTQPLQNGVYTWTVRAVDGLSETSNYVSPYTFTLDAPPTFPPHPLLSPANGATVSSARPAFDWQDASSPAGGPISYTLRITSSGVATNVWGQTTTATVIVSDSLYNPTLPLTDDVYIWTVQAFDGVGNVSDYAAPYTFTLEITPAYIYLPVLFKDYPLSVCPTASINLYETIPFIGPAADHPDYLHADLNLAVRGYDPTIASLGLIDYSGITDPDAPQFAGLFSPNRRPDFNAAYQVYSWNWGCGAPDGCLGPKITNPPVTVLGLQTTPDETINIPKRQPDIYPGGYKAIVLYAEEQRLTLGYTRDDTVASGYAVHLENVCVDPNLLALYRAQVNEAGWRTTGRLPVLRENQVLGTALDTEIRVAVKDKGTFLDPRSRKDWWQGY